MRILHLAKYFPPARGGIERFVAELSAAQAAMGNQVTVLSHQSDVGLPTVIEQVEGVTVVRSSTHFVFANSPVSFSLASGWKKLLRQFSPDIIHLHLPNLAAFAPLWLKTSVPMVCHWHADVNESPSLLIRTLYPMYRIAEQQLLSRMNTVFVSSKEYLDASVALSSWKEKCRVVPLGISEGRLLCDAGDSSHEKSDKFILTVGRLVEYKGFDLLIQAMAHVPSARLVIVGDGPLKENLRTLIASLGLSGRVSLTGDLSDDNLAELYQSCDVFCLPSINRLESFGIVLLEAMANAKPLVTGCIYGSGVMALNEHGCTGLIFPNGSVSGLAEALCTLLEDRELAKLLGEEGRRRLKDMYRIESASQSIQDEYGAVVGVLHESSNS